MNTTVPDALASLLLVEAILQHKSWSLKKWNEIYCDLANRQLNEVELEEKIAIATENPKTVAVSPSGPKEEADTLIVKKSIIAQGLHAQTRDFWGLLPAFCRHPAAESQSSNL